jgi:hypothetical protein
MTRIEALRSPGVGVLEIDTGYLQRIGLRRETSRSLLRNPLPLAHSISVRRSSP